MRFGCKGKTNTVEEMVTVCDRLVSGLKKEKTIIATIFVGLLCAFLFLVIAHRYGVWGCFVFTLTIIGICIFTFLLEATYVIRYFPAILFAFALFPLHKTIGIVSITQVDLVLITFYIISFCNHAPSPAKSRQVKLTHLILVALLFWLFFSSLMGLSTTNSLSGFISYVRFFLIYYFFSKLDSTNDQLKILITALVLAVFLEASLGIIQYVTKSTFGCLSDLFGSRQELIRLVGSTGNLFRIRGSFTYDTALGAFFAMLLPMVFSILFIRQCKKYRVFLAIILFLGFIALLFTFTRGAWLGTIIGFCVTIFYLIRKGYAKFPKLLLGFILIMVVLALLSTFFAPLIQDRLFGSNSTTSLNSRLNVYTLAIRAIRDYPLFGVGLDNLGIEADNYGRVKAHNILIQLACETGIVGASIYVFWLISVLKTAHRNIMSKCDDEYTIVSIGLYGGIIAILIHNMFAWNILAPMSGMCFFITVGLINSIALHKAQKNVKQRVL